jgi:hypothetical protein
MSTKRGCAHVVIDLMSGTNLQERVFNLEHLVNANVWFIPIHRVESIAREGARSRDKKPLIHVDYFYEMFAVSRNEHTDVSYR